eukprot:8385435-Pyramimonas_sp.AAC.1
MRDTLQEEKLKDAFEDGGNHDSNKEAQCVPPNIENYGSTTETTMSNTLQEEKLPEDRDIDFLAMEAPQVLQS